jgi:hypothetical protein
MKRVLVALAILLTLAAALATAPPKPAEAWGFCHDGKWIELETYCQLGIPESCSECWVTPYQR